MTNLQNKSECYEIHRQLTTSSSAKTEDGWTVTYSGDKNNSRSQTVKATRREEDVEIRHMHGSEGVARVLMKARSTSD
ncbi:hypothetical protein Syn8016DRAFT_1124 [Synechococcus sp. WH 8016]|nr:hypothetical protein Syn8016DRAFT_1124 [Synechococcus sp. WH 8016]